MTRISGVSTWELETMGERERREAVALFFSVFVAPLL